MFSTYRTSHSLPSRAPKYPSDLELRFLHMTSYIILQFLKPLRIGQMTHNQCLSGTIPSGRWEFLPPVPSVISDEGVEIVGYAVYNNNILLSLTCGIGSKFIAFHVRTKEWHHVKADMSSDMADMHFPFRGRAVVLGNCMYASSDVPVIEFFFDCKAYSLTPKLVLPRLKRKYLANMDIGVQTEYLVHLGGWDFCLVQTAYDYMRINRQPLWITTFRIVGGSGGSSNIEILHSTVFDVYIHNARRCQVNFSLSPDCKNSEPQGEREETRCQGKDAKGLKGKVWRITSSSQKKII